MRFYSESLERVTLPLRTQRPCEDRFWQVDLEYVREKIQDWEVRINMGQECITWQQNRVHFPCWEIMLHPARISGLYD